MATTEDTEDITCQGQNCESTDDLTWFSAGRDRTILLCEECHKEALGIST